MNTAAPQAMNLDQSSFRAIADLAYNECGLILVAEKSSMIQSRLRHRLRDLGLTTFADYCDILQSEGGRSEKRYLISALTTNVSHFFRENHHFDLLREEIISKLTSLHKGGSFRLWSAGCSNGQEAVSAAITLLESDANLERLDVRILATDIDPEVVQFARSGIYPERLMGGVPANLVGKYFDTSLDGFGAPQFKPKPCVKNMIKFNELNLLEDWPMRGRFDVIFCRNVVIYFDLETQLKLWPRYLSLLVPDGVLFLGHSERIANPEKFGFGCSGPTTYRRVLS